MELISQNFFLELRTTPGMDRGIFAAADVPSGTTLLVMDTENFISYQTMCEHPLFKQIAGETNSKMAEFAYFLAYVELAPGDSEEILHLKKYLSQLLTSYDNLVCWQDNQLEWLKDEALKSKIRQKKESLRQAYLIIKDFPLQNHKRDGTDEGHTFKRSKRGNRIRDECSYQTQLCSKAQEGSSLLQQVTFDRILSFIAVIESRNVYFDNTYDANSQVGALVPVLQMFNHSLQSQCKVDLTSRGYRVRSTRHICKGEQIFVNYGSNFTPEQFLELYGMLPNHSQTTEKENMSVRTLLGGEVKNRRMKLALTYNSIKQAQIPMHYRRKEPLHPRF